MNTYNHIHLDDDDEKKQETTQQPDALAEKFLKTRQVILSGAVTHETVEKAIRQMLLLEAASDKPIYLYIDSPGGSIDDGFGLFDIIRFINAPVYTIGTGLIASMGIMILLSVPKERRIALPNSHYLIHQPLISGTYRGVATDLEIQAEEIAKSKAKIVQIIAAETGKSIEQVTADTDRDHWLTAEEALSYGLVSKVITRRSEVAELALQ